MPMFHAVYNKEICKCGEHVLSTPHGTVYILDADNMHTGIYGCGKCNRRYSVMMIAGIREDAPDDLPGFFPSEIFTACRPTRKPYRSGAN